MRKLLAAALLVAAAAAAAVAWFGLDSSVFAPWRSPPPAQPIAVRTFRVAVGKLPQSFTAQAQLEPDKPVAVRAGTHGRVKSIAVAEGDVVSRGQTLLRLDDAAAKAELRKAHDGLASSRSDFERALELYNKGFLSRESLDEAARTVKAADANVELVDDRVKSTTVHAPAAGSIAKLRVKVGDRVAEAQEVASLESFEWLIVNCQVPELASPAVRKGQHVRVAADAAPKRAYEGRVLEIERLGEEPTQVAIRVQVRGRGGELRPGTPAKVFIPTAAAEEALVVPREALLELRGDEYVYKVVAGKAVRQKVEVGRQADGSVEVLGGLAKDDVVVSWTSAPLSDGARIKESGTAAISKIDNCAQCAEWKAGQPALVWNLR